MAEYNLNRFIDAQKKAFEIARSEIQRGRKRSHWMWYIFPQLKRLGYSETSKYYGLSNLVEAEEFLKHPLLGSRLIEICKDLLTLESANANEIFGSPDDRKLRSSMTLFSSVQNTDPVFQAVLNKFFNGIKDHKTVRILEESQTKNQQ